MRGARPPRRGRARGAARATGIAVLAALALVGAACAGSTPDTTPAARPAPTVGSTVTAERPPTTAPTTEPATSSTTPLGVAGAADAGDADFPGLGNGGYDVQRYEIDLRADPPSGPAIDVRDTITAVATVALASFHLDLAGMDVRAVHVDGAPAAFVRDGAELIVGPSRPIAAGATFTTVVEYSGVPAPVRDGEAMALGWLRTGSTTYVVSEPNGAHGWLASNDHPGDKARFTFRIDVPEGITAAANGRLASSTTANGRTTWVWDDERPMATYLATVAIGALRIVDAGTTAGGVRIRHVVPAASASTYTAALSRTGELVDALAAMFGPYPFGDYGVLVIDARLGYALETQTLSLFDRGIVLSDSSRLVQVHELAHQWFGNSVTVRAWRDVWLNEGFATYAESLYRERTEPGFDIDATMRALARTRYAPIGDPGPADLFDKAVYDRGALALHALRRTIGDDAFSTVLRAWAAEHAHANGSTAELAALATRVAGRDVGPLLDAWLNADPMPALPA